MACRIINPKTEFPLAYDGEPFSSYHKKNEFKVGNNHLRCEVIQRARLDPNWVGSRRGNDDPPKTGSWSKNKCEEWLLNNPIKNDEDYQYILDTVTKLIQVVSFSNHKQCTVGTTQIDDLQFKPSTPVSSTLTTLENSPVILKIASPSILSPNNRSTESISSRNKVTSTSKRTGLMDPATFKLVLEHQKEYSLEDKAIQSQDPIMIAGKKEWSTFWTASTKKARKKKKG